MSLLRRLACVLLDRHGRCAFNAELELFFCPTCDRIVEWDESSSRWRAVRT